MVVHKINTKNGFRLFTATFVSIVISLALGSFILLSINNYLRNYVTKTYENQQAISAASLGAAVSTHVSDAAYKLQLIAAQPDLINTTDPNACNKKIDEMIKATNHSFNNLARVNANGVFVCSGNRKIIGQKASKYGDYIPKLIADPEHKPVISRLVKGLTGVDGDAIAIHVPVYDQNQQFVGTIGGAIYVKDMESKFFKNTLTRNGRVALVDDDGYIIYHTDPAQRGASLADKEDLKRYSPSSTLQDYMRDIKTKDKGVISYSLDGQLRTGVYQNITIAQGRHWSILVVVPKTDIEMVLADARINQILATLIILLSASIAFITFITGRSMLRLSRAEASLEQANKAVERKVNERTHELVQSQARLQASINSLPLGYLMLDPAGKVLTENHAAKKIIDSSHKRDMLQLDKFTKDIQTSKVVLHELQLDAKYVQLLVAPIMVEGSSSEFLGSVVLIEDISDQKALERSRDEFFSIASHELRTPLTAIKGNSSMLLDIYKQVQDSPEIKEMVTDIHDSSNRLIGIVNEYLDMSRLEQGEAVYKQLNFSANEVISAVMEEMQTLASDSHCQLVKTGDDATIYADIDRVKQILINILSNAMKFTQKGTVTIHTIKKLDYVEIEITDTGRGIPQNMQHLLFHKYQQAGSSILTRDTSKGTGLGLYISRLIAEGQGGKLRLKASHEGRGTTFALTLPSDKKNQ